MRFLLGGALRDSPSKTGGLRPGSFNRARARSRSRSLIVAGKER